jgi:hypothetical protein
MWCLIFMQDCSFIDTPDAEGWFDSADALARGLARALTANDREALDRFRISRDEYMRLVWPELPVSSIAQWKGQSGFVWSQHAAKSDAGLRYVLGRFGGKSLTIRSVEYLASVQDYKTFKLFVRPAITATDSSGADIKVSLLGTIIERSGRFKVFSYSIKD